MERGEGSAISPAVTITGHGVETPVKEQGAITGKVFNKSFKGALIGSEGEEVRTEDRRTIEVGKVHLGSLEEVRKEVGVVRSRQEQATKVFVCNLPQNTSEAWLRSTFGRWGRLESADPIRRPNKRGHYFGFLVFRSREEAERVVDRMNGFRVRGYTFFVALAWQGGVLTKQSRPKAWVKLERTVPTVAKAHEQMAMKGQEEPRLLVLTGDEVLKHRLLAENGRLGIALSACSLDLLEASLEREGIWNLEVRRFGNRVCLLNSVEETDLGWVNPWVKLLDCPGDVCVQEGSFQWFCLEGIPFHGWSVENVSKIMDSFGSVLYVHDSFSSSFDKAWVLLKMQKYSESKIVELTINNAIFPICVRSVEAAIVPPIRIMASEKSSENGGSSDNGCDMTESTVGVPNKERSEDKETPHGLVERYDPSNSSHRSQSRILSTEKDASINGSSNLKIMEADNGSGCQGSLAIHNVSLDKEVNQSEDYGLSMRSQKKKQKAAVNTVIYHTKSRIRELQNREVQVVSSDKGVLGIQTLESRVKPNSEGQESWAFLKRIGYKAIAKDDLVIDQLQNLHAEVNKRLDFEDESEDEWEEEGEEDDPALLA